VCPILGLRLEIDIQKRKSKLPSLTITFAIATSFYRVDQRRGRPPLGSPADLRHLITLAVKQPTKSTKLSHAAGMETVI
jgi:hypothetical protein